MTHRGPFQPLLFCDSVNSPVFISLSSLERFSSPFIILVALRWSLFSMPMPQLYWGAWNATQYSCCAHQHWVKRRVHPPQPVCNILLSAALHHSPSLQQGHIAGSHLTCCPPRPPSRYMPSCFPAMCCVPPPPAHYNTVRISGIWYNRSYYRFALKGSKLQTVFLVNCHK